jgi:uncharacterized protein YjiS (DUF1127 family)
MTGEAAAPARNPATIGVHNPHFTIVDCLLDCARAVETWRQRHKASMQGARVESRILSDLGISQAQRFIEVNKPFWGK